jgi:hypothetical protein
MRATLFTALIAGPSLVIGSLALEQEYRLQGVWEVTHVQKDGKKDSAQIGATLTFTGDTVTFEPKAKVFTSIS